RDGQKGGGRSWQDELGGIEIGRRHHVDDHAANSTLYQCLEAGYCPQFVKVMPRKTILVVDDEKPQRDILQEILTTAGYDVTSAASGEAALKFAKERSFDLALTD